MDRLCSGLSEEEVEVSRLGRPARLSLVAVVDHTSHNTVSPAPTEGVNEVVKPICCYGRTTARATKVACVGC